MIYKTKTNVVFGLLLILTGCSQPEESSSPDMLEDDVMDMSMTDLSADEVDQTIRDMPTADLTEQDAEDTGPECVDDTACGFDQTCDAGQCVCAPSKCAPGWGCVEGGSHCRQLDMSMACTPGSCPEGQACSTDLGRCIDIETPPSCDDGESASCQGNDDCTGMLGVCDQGCCVECVDDSTCSGNQVCMDSSCVEPSPPSCQVCDPNNPGACNMDTPLCFQGCCVACLVDVDCRDGESCSDDNTCVPKPSCVDDPSICTMSERCDTISGECRPTCQGSVNGECPEGQHCNPITNQCESGITECGRCNPGCTCDGGLTCDGINCIGCNDGIDPRCPMIEGSSQLCLSGVCL